LFSNLGLLEYSLIISLTAFLSILFLPALTTNAERAHNRLSELIDSSKRKRDSNKQEGSIFLRAYQMVDRYIQSFLNKQIRKGNFASLELKLKQAGMHDTTPLEFWTQKILIAIGLSFVGLLTRNVTLVLVFALLGFFLKDYKLKEKIEKRQFQLRNEIPDFLDLVSVTYPCCANIEHTFELVCGKVDSEISNEFRIALNEIKVGRKKRVVFNELALRTGIKEVSSLVTQINQAEVFGTGLEDVLISQARAIRQSKKEIAEQTGNKASFLMFFPASLLLGTSILIIAAPFVVQFIDSMKAFQ